MQAPVLACAPGPPPAALPPVVIKGLSGAANLSIDVCGLAPAPAVPVRAQTVSKAPTLQEERTSPETVASTADEDQTTPPDANSAPGAPAPWSDAVVAAPTAEKSVRKQAWSATEDARLQELVTKYGPSNWSRIAADLPSRIGKQCRERWHNHLSPAVKKEHFSDAEVSAPPL